MLTLRLFGPRHDTDVEAIIDRLRTILSGHRIELAAEELALTADPLHTLIEGPGHNVDTAFLVDVIAAVVHRWGVDPKWLLTGVYDSELHREALLLGEDRSSRGVEAVRELVQGEFETLHTPRFFLSLPFMQASSGFRSM